MRLIDADHLVSLVNDATILGDGFKQAFTAIVNGEPTIEPERKKGKWIQVEEKPYFRKHFHSVCCSECRTKGYENWNFCPNCGADMRGEGENDV